MTVRITGTRLRVLAASLLMGCRIAGAADQATVLPNTESNNAAAATQSSTTNDEISRLKAQLAEQQKMLEALQSSIQTQQKMLEKAMSSPVTPAARLGEVASTTAMIPPSPAPAMAMPVQKQPGNQTGAGPSGSAAPGGSNPCEAGVDTNAVPPYLRIGSTCIVPIGFMDFTAVIRDKYTTSGIGSNFGSVPLNNTYQANTGEFKLSPQNSRLGFRVDSNYKGAHVIGYLEFDFLNTPSNNGLEVTNGAYTPRLRLFWGDVRKDKWEILGGQSWSMLTPNRKGLSALPGDIFFSQVIDVNYVAGLTWTRQPQFRVMYHPSDKVTLGVSFEQPEQYVGGGGGSQTITPPTAFAALVGTQLNNNTTALNTPTKVPDTVVKLAFDPSAKAHIEVGGIIRGFRIVNPVSPFATQSTVGGGFSANVNFEIAKGLRVVSNNFYSQGGGRYIFGQAPDLIVNGDGTIGLVTSRSTVDGFEYTFKKTLFYGYYGGVFIDRATTIDPANGRLVGYGQGGSTVNRSVHEGTIGFNQTLYKNVRYGAFNLMGQYEYLSRNLWYFNPGSPAKTHDNTVYLNLRYTLPGDMPKF